MVAAADQQTAKPYLASSARLFHLLASPNIAAYFGVSGGSSAVASAIAGGFFASMSRIHARTCWVPRIQLSYRIRTINQVYPNLYGCGWVLQSAHDALLAARANAPLHKSDSQACAPKTVTASRGVQPQFSARCWHWCPLLRKTAATRPVRRRVVDLRLRRGRRPSSKRHAPKAGRQSYRRSAHGD